MSTPELPLKTLLAALVAILTCVEVSRGATYTVTNVDDSGPGSLRQAILDANANPNASVDQPDLVVFDIPQSGLQTVLLATALPPLLEAVTIDGYTQSDSRPNISVALTNDAVLRVELNGVNVADRAAHGIDIRASNCTIRGLVIHRFGGDGVHIGFAGLPVSGNRVGGCFIGTNATGTAAAPNQNGVRIAAGATNNVIGGPIPADCNVVSGNVAGVVIEGAGTDNNVIERNRIGTERNGTGALLNDFGITLSDAKGTVVIGNVVAGKSPNPAILELAATGGSSRVQANRIGVDFFGHTIIGYSGISLLTPNNLIGGTDPGEGNCVAGIADQFGASAFIELRGASAVDNVIQGNAVGVDVSQTRKVGSGDGILIGQSGRNLIGGSVPGARNVVTTIAIYGRDPGAGNVVQGNYVGVGADGTGLPSPSAESACIFVSGDYHTIGGDTAGARNVIGGCETGIYLELANFNLVRGNSIGSDPTGTFAVPNTVGIRIFNRKPFNVVNRGNSIIDNLVSGNLSDGILLGAEFGLAPEETVIQGNLIGVAGDGVAALPNGGNGVVVSGAANLLGGPAPGEGNIIANNGMSFDPPEEGRITGHGVHVGSTQNGRGNRISGNSIYNNVRLGINHYDASGPPSDVTPNDPGDADGYQNYPVLMTVSRSGSNVRFIGTLHSKPLGTYRIEFFGNETVDPSGFGEGQFYLGASSLTTDAGGNAAFDVTLAAPPEAHSFSTTAIDAQGHTSEFSTGQGQLVNISTRLNVGTGEDVGIAGFIVHGTQPKPVLLRAIGPSLTADGQPLPGRLENPTLQLLDSAGTVIAANDDWKESQPDEIYVTGIPPQHDLESAITTSLPAGAYTAILAGRNETTGIALVEVYDLQQATGSRLANISTRGFVATGDNIMIGGFIVGPVAAGNARVVIRALGPSLAAAGVSRTLSDPIAELRDTSGTLVARSDDWKENQAAIEATGLQPGDDRESALVSTFAPGNYTVLVSGRNDVTGVALVELYNIE